MGTVAWHGGAFHISNLLVLVSQVYSHIPLLHFSGEEPDRDYTMSQVKLHVS